MAELAPSFCMPACCLYNARQPQTLRQNLFDGHGHLLVSNQNVNLNVNGTINEYRADSGDFVKALVPYADPNSPPAPRGIVLDGNTLFVASLVGYSFDPTQPGLLQAFNGTTAAFRGTLVPPAGLVPSSSFHPRGVVIGPDGLLYVSNDPVLGGTDGDILRFYPATGNFKDIFVSNANTAAKQGPCSCDFNRPEGLVFGPDGNVYVTSFATLKLVNGQMIRTSTDKILIFSGLASDKPGTFIGKIDLDQVGQNDAYAPSGAIARALHAITLLIGNQMVRDMEELAGVVDVFTVPNLCPLDISPYEPCPIEDHGRPIAGPHQEHQMGNAPQPPRERSAEPDPAEVGDSRFTPNCRQTTEMMISEWRGFRNSENACRNQLRYIGAALLGCRRQAGYWPAVPGVRRSCIADDEDVSKVGNREVAHNLDPAGAVGFGIEPLCRRRGHDAGGPNHRLRVSALVRLPQATEKTAFVFAGGGSLGAVQVGMLRELTRYGVSADFVVGSSVGAINASYFASAPNPAGIEKLETIWRTLRRHDVFPFTLPSTVINSPQPVRAVLKPPWWKWNAWVCMRRTALRASLKAR